MMTRRRKFRIRRRCVRRGHLWHTPMSPSASELNRISMYQFCFRTRCDGTRLNPVLSADFTDDERAAFEAPILDWMRSGVQR